jgi:hypothetical protein
MIAVEFDFILVASARFRILVDLSKTTLYHHLFLWVGHACYELLSFERTIDYPRLKVSLASRRINSVSTSISIENGCNVSHDAKPNIFIIKLLQLDSSDEPTMILNRLIH